MMQKEKNDLEPVGLHIIDACVLETKDPVGTSFLTRIEAGNCGDSSMESDIESFNLKKSLAGQQKNFHEAYKVKVAHLDSSMYVKLPPL